MGVAEHAEADLWARYKAGNDLAARDHLVQRYTPWASAIARQIHGRVWAYSVDCEDFVQNATIGLLEAVNRYDPSRGVAFQAFAKRRIRGAVFNGIRAILSDRPPTHLERYSDRLDHLQDDDVTDPFAQVVDSVIGLGLGYILDNVLSIQADNSGGTSAYAEARQMEAALAVAVEQIPERLREIVYAHYFEHVPFSEIANRYALSKGRISQLHRAALDKLREALSGSR